MSELDLSPELGKMGGNTQKAVYNEIGNKFLTYFYA